MSSLADAPDLVGFFSYSREDDEGSGGKLSKLRERIQEELRAQIGRTKRDFRLWQDKVAIAHGELWEDTIKKGISESVFFIPIITPTAVRSYHCKFELDSFLARERELGRSNLVFPILYIPVPALTDDRWRQDPLLSIIGSRQYEEWQHLRHLDVSSTEVALRVEKFCANICRALQQEWLSPEERREAEARRVAEAERRRQQEAEAKQREDQEERQRRAESVAALVSRGDDYYDKNDPERAIAEYTEAIRLDPKNFDAFYKRGHTYHVKEDYDQALADYTEAIRLNPKNAYAFFLRGRLYRPKNDYDRAVADYTQAIRLDPKHLGALFNRGLAYDEKKDYDRAITDYTEVIRLDPQAYAFDSRGTAYYDKYDYDQAIADFTEAIRLDPKYARAFYWRGRAKQMKGDASGGAADISRAKQLDPSVGNY